MKSLIDKLKGVSGRVRFLLLVILLIGLVVLIAVIVSVTFQQQDDKAENVPVVLTHTGRVQGRKVTLAGEVEVSEFLYIPYAVPPVGERRWTHSTLIQEPWSDTYLAGGDGDIKCVQGPNIPPQGQENCLCLSVRTPHLPDISKADDTGLPVIVWIHGGSLTNGFAEDKGYSADADFTAEVNAVTVNINYRLDLLGFLSVPEIWEDGENYGNFGINDAVVALQWVNKNIKNFGGDGSQVTIIGESSGGTIVLALVATLKADGLFNKAIALSPVSNWKTNYTDAHKRRPEFLKDVQCDNMDKIEQTRVCLKSVDVELVIKSSTTANRGWGFYDFPMSQGIMGESMDFNIMEPTILPFFPQDIPEQKGKRHPVQLIVANTAQETANNQMFYDQNRLTSWPEAHQLLKTRLANFLKREDNELLEAIKESYNFSRDSANWWPQMFWDTLLTDIRATCPLNRLSKRMSTSPHLRVNRLYIEHRPSSTLSSGRRWGAWHGWDTEAMFGFKYFKGTEYNQTTPHDWELSTAMRTLVRTVAHDNFASQDNLFLRNSSPWTEGKKEVPQMELCTFLDSNGFIGWGWQN